LYRRLRPRRFDFARCHVARLLFFRWLHDQPVARRQGFHGIQLVVPAPLHAVWCRPTPSSEWAFEFLLNDSDETQWLFRRDHHVRMPLADIARTSDDGIPYLVPEIVLLYKAKNVREHDVQDLDTALPSLDAAQRAWLRAAIAVVHPGHPWLERLG